MSDGTDPVNPARKPVPRRLRFEILRRDNYTCRYCGASAPDATLTVDHVIPVVLGGGDEPSNLVTACRGCNAGKASTSPDERIVEDVDAAAMLFARAMERSAEIRRLHHADEKAATDYIEKRWKGWCWTQDGERVTAPMPEGWRSSVLTFIERGLNVNELNGYITVAMESGAWRKDKWRYFCGCCWRELTDRTELARRLIEDGKV